MSDVSFDEWYDEWYDKIDTTYGKPEPNSVSFTQIMEAYKESKEERKDNE